MTDEEEKLTIKMLNSDDIEMITLGATFFLKEDHRWCRQMISADGYGQSVTNPYSSIVQKKNTMHKIKFINGSRCLSLWNGKLCYNSTYEHFKRHPSSINETWTTFIV